MYQHVNFLDVDMESEDWAAALDSGVISMDESETTSEALARAESECSYPTPHVYASCSELDFSVLEEEHKAPPPTVEEEATKVDNSGLSVSAWQGGTTGASASTQPVRRVSSGHTRLAK